MRKYKSKVRLLKGSFGQHFLFHGGLSPLSHRVIFICKVSIKRNGLLFKKITFKIQNVLHEYDIDFSKHDIDIFINDTWHKYAGAMCI
jgi:hypothetical protein